MMGAVLFGLSGEIQRQSGLDEASTVPLSVDHRRGQFEPVGLQATLNNLLKGRGV
jgi:hypothetical protein